MTKKNEEYPPELQKLIEAAEEIAENTINESIAKGILKDYFENNRESAKKAIVRQVLEGWQNGDD